MASVIINFEAEGANALAEAGGVNADDKNGDWTEIGKLGLQQ